MSEGKSYKEKAADVRHAARGKLAELRQERLTRRRAQWPAWSSDETAARKVKAATDTVFEVPDSEERATDVVFSEDQGVAMETSAPATVEIDQDPPQGVITDARDDEISNLPMDMSSSAAESEYAAAIDLSPAPSIADDHDPVTTDHSADAAIITPPQSATQGDLHTLPGAGNGLVWMLNQCDIHTLADLSMADAGDLSRRLGVVGQILNVQTWIDFAQSRSAAAAG